MLVADFEPQSINGPLRWRFGVGTIDRFCMSKPPTQNSVDWEIICSYDTNRLCARVSNFISELMQKTRAVVATPHLIHSNPLCATARTADSCCENG